MNRGYFIRGYKRLFKGPTMDSLIAVGATASMAYSIYALFWVYCSISFGISFLNSCDDM